MDHGGKGRARTRADVGSGSSQSARSCDPPEEGRDDVANAKSHELGIGIVLRAGHAIGNHGGKERFDRAEHRDGERGR